MKAQTTGGRVSRWKLRRHATKVVFLFLIVLSLIVTGLHKGRLNVAGGDVPAYLNGAYHLFHQATFSELPTSKAVSPGVGREPGQAFFLAMLMAVDSDFAGFRPECLTANAVCDQTIYRAASLANLGLILLTGIAMILVGRLVLRSEALGLACGAYLLLNLQLNKGWADPMSDRLAMWLVSLAMLSVAWTWRSGRIWPWAFAGLAFAALTLTKAVFLPYVAAISGCVLAIVLIGKGPRTRVLASLAAALLVYGVLVGAWMLRNQAISGELRLTDARGGIALSTRAVFDDMTPAQYAASFVYWTRGPGSGLARRWFAPETVEPFDLDLPGGFYDRGQNGYPARVEETVKARQVDYWHATKIVDSQIVHGIVKRPFTHLLTTIPLFYRGVWVDEFIVIGLPMFLFAFWRAARDRDGLRLLLLSTGAFNLLFYALFSLNIPRYQMTAMPAVALGFACALKSVLDRRNHASSRAAMAVPSTIPQGGARQN
jgi:hypothetical protein